MFKTCTLKTTEYCRLKFKGHLEMEDYGGIYTRESGGLRFVKMSVLFRLIYRVNAIS